MQYRKLGATEAEISEIGFGAWGIGGKQWLGGEDTESLRALKRAFDLGINFVDTALAYGDGHSEQLVGQAVKNSFRKIHVATKIPPKNRIWPARPEMPISEVFPYDYIVESTDESLRNLGVEQIYLQQFHVWTDAWAGTEEWRRAVEDLRRSGKVRYFGISISEHEPDSALEAIKTGIDQCSSGDLQHLRSDARAKSISALPKDESRCISARSAGRRRTYRSYNGVTRNLNRANFANRISEAIASSK